MSRVGSVPEGKSNPAFNNSPSSAELGNAVLNVHLVSVSSRVPLDTGNQQLVQSELGPTSQYDPYQHRDVKHPTNNTETMLHLLKGSLGTGILAMPNAFKNAGWVIGLFGTLFIGLICTYCIHMLVNCAYVLSGRKKVASLNYPQTFEEALRQGPGILPKFAPYAGHLVNVFLFIYQAGACCVYIVFVASNIRNVANFHTGQDTEVQIFMLYILLPLILLNYIRNLKYLVPFSTLANAITFAGFVITLYYVLRDGLKDAGDRHMIGTWEGIPLFFGTVLFALEAIGVIMPLENNMKTPVSFGGTTGVLNRSMFFIILLYMGLGLLGFLQYGDATKGSITLNLPDTEILGQSVQLLLAFAIFITYALQCYVAIDIVWNIYLSPHIKSKGYRITTEFVVRTLLVVLTFLVAAAVPELDLFISLIGAFTLSILGIVLPAVIQMATFEDERSSLRLAKNIFLIVFGLVGLVTGTYISVKDIIHEYFTPHPH
ncbi:proton-coupled amino acid transporter-like protein CG1139 [Neocloeon triangulifer]|uniref:proton-coupled amino acid transporter-like protein CG1139 n=1 Tax=Neocloeon triangulifer TaxID=2078957 RepID=UPI00286F9B6D|nr:proton-coupled amino acid transporter-like protein CG1139 [Neocloeon triangulifer]